MLYIDNLRRDTDLEETTEIRKQWKGVFLCP